MSGIDRRIHGLNPIKRQRGAGDETIFRAEGIEGEVRKRIGLALAKPDPKQPSGFPDRVVVDLDARGEGFRLPRFGRRLNNPA